MIQGIARFFVSGGDFMWVILCVLAAGFAVTVERLIFYFFVCKKNGLSLVTGLIKLINQGKGSEAESTLKERNDPLGNMLKVALTRYNAGLAFGELEEGVQESAIKEMPRMMARLNYLSLFANIATLLGLIGTISGLQASFSSLAAVEASKKAVMLASGIAEAMNCTAFGLITAVPCMVLYTYFYNMQAGHSKDIDEALVRFMNFLKKKMS
jgi:biopolymer transport protein ExbB/TolQ